MERRWEREDIEKLILLIQENDCLYSVKSANYIDRTKKTSALIAIKEKLETKMIGITVEDIQKKWKNVRTQYMRELRLVKNSKKSGAGVDDIYKPKLWCFHQLSFLEAHVATRESEDNIETPSTSRSTSLSEIDDSCFSFSDETVKKQPKKSKFGQMRREFSMFEEIIEKKKNSKKYGWLGTLVASQMENIDPEDQQNAAWEIQTVIKKYVDKCSKRRDEGTSLKSSSEKDLLQLSMSGVFEDEDFV